MLRSTDAELKRKEEVLSITTQMLRTAETELARREREVAHLRDALCRAQLSLANAKDAAESRRREDERTQAESVGTCMTPLIDVAGSSEWSRAREVSGISTEYLKKRENEASTATLQHAGDACTLSGASAEPRCAMCTPSVPQVGIVPTGAYAPLTMRPKQVVRDARSVMESVYSAERREYASVGVPQSLSSIAVLR